ncbi:MAG TPA: hypothetical protein VEU77_05415 [Candidatus Acidoferrales bacterium]|nr:hypothetical protein [Candidatus Acidoferrales bacterium]
MSIRRLFQIVTLALALAFTFTATSAAPAFACPPGSTDGGLC